MRVLVTGHRGYLGSVLAGVMRHSGFDVYGIDADLFHGCDFGRTRDEVPGFACDVSELDIADLVSFDAVVHLAWLPGNVNSPALDAREANIENTVRLAESCREARVPRFAFLSTWEVYRCGGRQVCNELAPTDSDRSAAGGKGWVERKLLELANASFRPIIIRAADGYGVSPRLRLDLTVNRWTAQAVTSGTVIVDGNGATWRPLVHVEDLARACAALVSAPDDVVAQAVFNVVAPDQNLRLGDIADSVAELTNSVRRLHDPGEPGHHFGVRLESDRFLRALPRFRFRWPLDRGIAQLRDAMTNAGMTPSDLRGDRFDRCRRYTSLVDGGPPAPRHAHRQVPSLPALS